MHSGKLTLAAMLLGMVVWSGDAEAGLSRQIRDWTVECSNGLTCDMSFSDWSAKGVQHVSFQRKGAPGAELVLRLRSSSEFSPDEDDSLSYRFVVDGKELMTVPVKDLVQEEHADMYALNNQPMVRALLEAMAIGKKAEVEVSGKAGKQVLPIKLNGVKGAMLYMDEAQGRLDRTDALEAKGVKEPPKGVTARDILSLEDMPEIIRKDFTESGGACSDLEPETIKQFQGFDVTIGLTQLIAVPCATGGAYNQPYALYNGSEVFERISFPYIDGGKPTTLSTAMNIDFNPVTKIMTSFFRGRGIGDCGEYIKWQLNDRLSRLELLEIRNKPDCDEGSNDPTTFPLTWKAGT